jgi:integrase
MRRSHRRLLTVAGVPPARFHDLRHTAATLLLAQGIYPKIVSEMLGHSQTAITLDLYSHVTPTNAAPGCGGDEPAVLSVEEIGDSGP